MLRFFCLRLSVSPLVCKWIIGFCAFFVFVVPIGAQEAKKEDKQPTNSLEKEITESVDAFLATDFSDTNFIRKNENQKNEFDKLAKRFAGRRITLTFPIQNVDPASKVAYCLRFPKDSGCRLQGLIVGLSKEQALRISSASVLQISGNVKLLRSNMGDGIAIQKFEAGAASKIVAISFGSAGSVKLLVEQPAVRVITRDKDGNVKMSISAKPLPPNKSNGGLFGS